MTDFPYDTYFIICMMNAYYESEQVKHKYDYQNSI